MTNFATHAEDWPAWTGPLGRNVARETNLPADFDRDTGRNIKWAAELGDVAFGCPTVSQGRVYIGTNLTALQDDPRFDDLQGGVLACLDKATGTPLWHLVTPVRTEGFPERTHMIHQRWGLCSSPAVDEDRVYVVTNGDDLLCLDTAGLRNGNDGSFQDEATFMAGEGRPPIALETERDADILWRYDIPGELGVAPHDTASSSVLVEGEHVYSATSNGIGEGSPVYALNQQAPGFIGLNKRTGQYRAREQTTLGENLFHAQWGSATRAVVNGKPLILLGGNDGVCYAFDPLSDAGATASTGGLNCVWSFDANPPHYRNYPSGKPIYYYQGDLRVYQTKVKDGLDTTDFNAGDGSFIGPNEILASPIFYENRVYVLTGRDPLHGHARGTLSCIDATKTGEISESGLVWRFESIGRSLSSVAVDAGLVYAADRAGIVYCLDTANGALYWQHDTKHEIWGNPLVADDKLYINTKHSFWIFAAEKEKQVLFTSRGGSETGPIAANGVVYAFIRGTLYAIAEGT
jgi:outer membrane protein assembly factor BamB